MAAVNSFNNLANKYERFQHPKAIIEINDTDLSDPKKGAVVSDLNVDLTCGYEASIAEFSLYDVFDIETAEFKYDKFKRFIFLGSKVEIYLGYGPNVKLVFLGVITRVNYLYEENSAPCVRVTAMDVKGIMMAGSYSRQLKSTYYSDAVKEILQRTAYEKLKSSDIVRGINVENTPDKMAGAEAGKDVSIEMVAESDYEFVVKAAKKNNFEFYTECGQVYFRQAKGGMAETNRTLIELGPGMGIKSLDVSYDMTGLVEKIIARGTDVGKASVITANKKNSAKISGGNKAGPLLKGSQKVFTDASIKSKAEAERRVASLYEEMSYRLGSLNCVITGIPEMHPGHFINLVGLGTEPSNRFYLVKVCHKIDTDGRYTCELTGKAASIANQSGAAKIPGF